MRRHRRFLALALTFAATACRMGQPSVRDILANPAAFEDRTVTISGTVTESVNVLVLKYYQVDDGTGHIVVVTHKAVPPRGAKVEVTGKVQQAFAIGDQTLTVINTE
jgi:hypothetical protein